MSDYLKTCMCLSLTCLWVVFASAEVATEKPSCAAIELIQGNSGYNRLVCDGVGRMQQKRYAEAAKVFESAMREKLFEYPNVELYPRLALTYAYMGNNDKAKENLAKAELALSVLIGAIRCEETDKGFHLIERDGQVVRSSYQMEISGRMCGAAYEGLYAQRSFEATLHDAELIVIYQNAKKEIDAGGAVRR